MARNLLFSEIINFGVNSVIVPVWKDKKVNKKVIGISSLISHAIRDSIIIAFGLHINPRGSNFNSKKRGDFYPV
ncbi:MAG: hypothetical protein A2Y71_15445 [Bacteroidetes bacterium RBG_13_42_15]|nr:MAG: hypothetical protein A2Y71_15445 [Bacteroidetes bacterium RBG_13_42_15]